MKDRDNFYKKFYRRTWWLSWFIGIPFISYILTEIITKSKDWAMYLAIITLIIWIIIFFISGIYKDFWSPK